MAGCHFSAPLAHACGHFRSRQVPDGRRQNLSSAGRTDSTFRRAGGVFSKTCSTAANPGRTARIPRKTGAHTAVICWTARIEGSGLVRKPVNPHMSASSRIPKGMGNDLGPSGFSMRVLASGEPAGGLIRDLRRRPTMLWDNSLSSL